MNNNIQAKELYDHFLENNSPRVIDLRDGDDYGAGHIPSALNIPYLRLRYSPGFIPDSEPIVLYTGGDDPQQDQEAYDESVRLLSEQGIQASVLEGGMAAWVKAGYPIEIE